MKQLAFWTTVLLLACACGTKRAQQSCRMEQEVVVYKTSGIPTAIALERLNDKRLIVAWSAAGETRFVLLNNDGEAVGESVRVDRYRFASAAVDAGTTSKTFWPVEEHVSMNAEVLSMAVLGADRVALGVLEQATSSGRGGAYSVIIDLADASAAHVVYLGEVGEFASGIALASVDGSVYAAWHEGRADSSVVRTAKIDTETMTIVEKSEIPGGRAAANPALVANGERLLIAWQETFREGDKVGAEVKVSYLTVDLKLHHATTVAKCRIMDTAPALITINDKFGLAYRDDADDDDKAEFYFVMIDANGGLASSPARISRANGYQGPSIDYGEEFVFSAQIRSFQRDFLVGMNHFDLRGVKQGGEFQVYADKSNFIRVDLDVHGHNVLLVYGEDRRGSGRIFSGKVTCKTQPL